MDHGPWTCSSHGSQVLVEGDGQRGGQQGDHGGRDTGFLADGSLQAVQRGENGIDPWRHGLVLFFGDVGEVTRQEQEVLGLAQRAFGEVQEVQAVAFRVSSGPFDDVGGDAVGGAANLTGQAKGFGVGERSDSAVGAGCSWHAHLVPLLPSAADSGHGRLWPLGRRGTLAQHQRAAPARAASTEETRIKRADIKTRPAPSHGSAVPRNGGGSQLHGVESAIRPGKCPWRPSLRPLVNQPKTIESSWPSEKVHGPLSIVHCHCTATRCVAFPRRKDQFPQKMCCQFQQKLLA